MQAQNKPKDQVEMFKSRLDQILDNEHAMFKLANSIDWSYFEKEYGLYYTEDKGRPAKPIRLLVGLHYLKHMFDESDESVVERFIENPYWQYFCGYEYFQHKFPIEPTTLVKWRRRVGEKGIEKLFEGTIRTAKRTGLLNHNHLKRVNIDTTVQEKAIAFPTDIKLYKKMLDKLVDEAEERGIKLRQTYRRKAQLSLIMQGRYSYAKQMKRASKETKKVKNYLGRVTREIRRKEKNPDKVLEGLLKLSERLLKQKKEDKNKIYSLHAQEVECIAKGKRHKRYEFGCKVSVASTSRDNWVVGINAEHGNPWDGHTIENTLEQVERLTSYKVESAFMDRGYRGHDYTGKTKIYITGKKTLSRSLRKWLKKRWSIEPIISHLKSDNRMDRNYLKGVEGDKINALLCGCGANLRKLFIVFFLFIFKIDFIFKKIKKWFQFLNNKYLILCPDC